MTVFVADIAAYQQGLTIRQLQAAGFVAVIIKATEGAGYANPLFSGWLAEAKLLRFPVAAYHFAKPVSSVSAVAQARNIAALVPVGVPVWMDCEAGASRDDGYAVADRVRAAGGTVAGIYHGAKPKPGYGWWRAAYLSDPRGSCVSAYAQQGGDGAAEWSHGEDLWQFCQHGTVPGYSGGEVDFSAFRGTLAELLAHGWFHHTAIDPVTIIKGDAMPLYRAKTASVDGTVPVGSVMSCSLNQRWHLPASAAPLVAAYEAAGQPIVTCDGQDIVDAFPVQAGAPVVAQVDTVALVRELLAGLPVGSLTAADVQVAVEAGLRAVLHGV